MSKPRKVSVQVRLSKHEAVILCCALEQYFEAGMTDDENALHARIFQAGVRARALEDQRTPPNVKPGSTVCAHRENPMQCPMCNGGYR